MGELAKVRLLTPLEQQRIDALERQVDELQAVITALRAEREQLTRRAKRQAAPFSKGTHVAAPKRAGRKPGQGPVHFRAAPLATALSAPPITVPVTAPVCPACGLVQHAQRQVAGPVGEAYAALRDALPDATPVHTDDTGWQVAGRTAFLLALESDTETVYQTWARHRNAEVRPAAIARKVSQCSEN